MTYIACMVFSVIIYWILLDVITRKYRKKVEELKSEELELQSYLDNYVYNVIPDDSMTYTEKLQAQFDNAQHGDKISITQVDLRLVDRDF